MYIKKECEYIMLYAIDSTTKSKIEVVSKEEMNTYIQEQVSSLLSSGEGLSMFGVTATATEWNYCSGLTSNIQTQLNAKQSTITGGATTIVSSNLTASRALISNSSGKIAASSITTTKLGYLAKVTSDIQTQLNAKISTSASCNKNWAWSGQAGQPNWLWGSNDGSNCYVWNPANFRVNHA